MQRLTRILFGLLVAVGLSGCQSGMIRQAAVQANQNAVNVKSEIQKKIDAEEAFYNEQIKNAEDALAQNIKIKFANDLQTRATAFYYTNKDTSAADPRLADALREYVTTSINNWNLRQSEADAIISDIESQLQSGRQKIEQQEAKVELLQNKLKLLAQPSDLKFIINYISDTQQAYSKLQADSKK